MGIIQAITKKSQRADHVIIEIRITCILNEDSPSIYIYQETPWNMGRRKKGTKEEEKET